jgi:hypothetical protein
MAHSLAYLRKNDTPPIEAPQGFSWTVLFFGFLVPLYRHDWKTGLAMLALTAFFWPFPNLVMCWFYNRWYLNWMQKQGYTVFAVKSLPAEQF